MPRLPFEVVSSATETGSVFESNIESEVRVRDGSVRGGESKGESPSLGLLTTTGLPYSIVQDFTVGLYTCKCMSGKMDIVCYSVGPERKYLAKYMYCHDETGNKYFVYVYVVVKPCTPQLSLMGHTYFLQHITCKTTHSYMYRHSRVMCPSYRDVS